MLYHHSVLVLSLLLFLLPSHLSLLSFTQSSRCIFHFLVLPGRGIVEIEALSFFKQLALASVMILLIRVCFEKEAIQHEEGHPSEKEKQYDIYHFYQ